MPLAAQFTYVNCLCMLRIMGCSHVLFEAWLVAHAIAAALLQGNDLKTTCSAAAMCWIIYKEVVRTLM